MLSPAPSEAPQVQAAGRGHLLMLIPSQQSSFVPLWGPSASGHDGKCVSLRSQWLSLEEWKAVKTPSSSLPGWVMGLCPFQRMAGCDRVPVSLSLTSLLPEQSGDQPSIDFQVPMVVL